MTWWYVVRASGWSPTPYSPPPSSGAAAVDAGAPAPPTTGVAARLAPLRRGLATAGTALHVVAVWIDDYIDLTMLDLLVPFVSPWCPTALAFGIVGLYLLLVIELTSLARHRMPPQWWRRLHHLSLPALGASTVHLLIAGEDEDERPVLLAVGGGAGITAAPATLWLRQLGSG